MRFSAAKWYSNVELAPVLVGYALLATIVLLTRGKFAAMYVEMGVPVGLATHVALSPFYPALVLVVMAAGLAKEFLFKTVFTRFLLNLALFVAGIVLFTFYAYAVFSPMRIGVIPSY